MNFPDLNAFRSAQVDGELLALQIFAESLHRRMEATLRRTDGSVGRWKLVPSAYEFSSGSAVNDLTFRPELG